MTFASVNDMRAVLEFIFAAMAVVGVYTLVLITFLAVWSALHVIRTPKPSRVKDCIRPYPHECGVNGPCNGWPREK